MYEYRWFDGATEGQGSANTWEAAFAEALEAVEQRVGDLKPWLWSPPLRTWRGPNGEFIAVYPHLWGSPGGWEPIGDGCWRQTATATLVWAQDGRIVVGHEGDGETLRDVYRLPVQVVAAALSGMSRSEAPEVDNG